MRSSSRCAQLLQSSLHSASCCGWITSVLPQPFWAQQTSFHSGSGGTRSGGNRGGSCGGSSQDSSWTGSLAVHDAHNLLSPIPSSTNSVRSFSATSQHSSPHSGSSNLARVPHGHGTIAPAAEGTSSQQLLRAIREATEVQQLQVLLLRHADVWRAQHIAAAFRCFTQLRPQQYSPRQSQLSTLGLLLRGLLRVLDRLSAPDLVEALLCLGRFRLAPPAELEAIYSRLVQLLEAGEQPLSARLRPQQWASAARALAMLQSAQQQPHLRQGEWSGSRVVQQSRGSWAAGAAAATDAPDAADMSTPGSSSSTTTTIASADTSSSSSSRRKQSVLPPEALTGTATPVSSSSAADVGSSSELVSSSSSAAGALAQRGSMDGLWLLVFKGSVTQLDNFDANDAAGWCWALVRSGRWPQEAVRGALRSLRLRPHKLLPQHTLQVLAASVEAGVGNAEQWEVLLRALQKQRRELPLQVITRTLELMAARQQYLPDVAADLVASAAHHLRGAPSQHLLQLAAAMAELGHYQASVVKALCKQVTPSIPSLPTEDLGDLLWALLHLGHQGNDMDALTTAADQTLCDRPSLAHVTPAAAIKLLWVCYSMGLGSQAAHRQLVEALAACQPQQVPDGTLCLLHQTRLMLGGAPGGAAAAQRHKQQQQQQQQVVGSGEVRGQRATRGSRAAAGTQRGGGDATGNMDDWMEDMVIHDVGSTSQQQQQQKQEHVPAQDGLPWPEPLMAAAAAAAGAYAMGVAASDRHRRQQIGALLQQCGLQPLPVHSTPVAGMVADIGLLGQAGGLAVLASGVRYTRSQPVQLLGYWRNAEHLLRQQGWRVVHLPPYEWEALVGVGSMGDDALVHVANKLLEAGVTW